MTQSSTLSPVLFVALAVLLGLGASAAFRRRPWVVFAWIPTTGLLVLLTFKFLRRLLAISSVRGPDAGFAGMEGIFLLPLCAGCIAGLVICFFTRPVPEARRRVFIFPAIALCFGIWFAWVWQITTGITIEFVDINDKPLADVPIDFSISESGLKMSHSIQSTDAAGRFSVSWKRKQSIELQLQPRFHGGDIRLGPGFWKVTLFEESQFPGQLEIAQSWQSSFASDVTVNQGFCETVPIGRAVHLTVVVANDGSIALPAALREKIRAALAARESNPNAGPPYPYICRNTAAAEFTQQLIQAYQRNGDSGRLLEGLSECAATLAQINVASKEVQRNLAAANNHPNDWGRFQADQLLQWARVVRTFGQPQLSELAAAQAKINSMVQTLIRFSIEAGTRDPEALKILQALRNLGHAAIPQVIEAVQATSPNDNRSMYAWSHSLWMIGAHFRDLSELVSSDKPELVLLAFEATPSEEMEGTTAAQMLERFEAVRPQVTDQQMASRIDMEIKMLRTRIEREQQHDAKN